MCGDDQHQPELFSYRSLEDRVAADHPLRRIRGIADAALARLSARFEAIYGDVGRPSIAPEKLLRALLLQVLYSIRSERALMDQIDLHLGFRWFIGLFKAGPPSKLHIDGATQDWASFFGLELRCRPGLA